MNFKTKFKENKGITLIALVVTIIVLLILAGISINALAGQNGLLNRAVGSKEATRIAQTEEAIQVAVMDAATQGLGTITDVNLKTALNDNVGAGKYEITGDETKGWTVTVDEKAYKISSTGNMKNIESLPTGTGTTPYLPDDEKFEKVEGTDLSTGLVIKEKATGSEYVWVEVPRTAGVYPTAGVDISSFTDEEYTNIEADLHTYTNDYRDGTSYSDVYYADSTTGWFTGTEAYDAAKKKMLKSVYQNGGFWVGRYEAGIENETEIRKEASATATLTPVTKQNMYPYNYVTRTQAKVLAEKVESGSYTSSLMFGVQWDLVLKFIEVKGKATQSNLKTDSTTIGNYYNSAFTLNRGEFAQYSALSDWKAYNSEEKSTLVTGSQKKAQSSEENGIVLTTGATEATNLQNIYDIAGNVCEWTLEKTSYTFSCCASRGGGYYFDGSGAPASYHYDIYTSYGDGCVGFRLSLY